MLKNAEWVYDENGGCKLIVKSKGEEIELAKIHKTEKSGARKYSSLSLNVDSSDYCPNSQHAKEQIEKFVKEDLVHFAEHYKECFEYYTNLIKLLEGE